MRRSMFVCAAALALGAFSLIQGPTSAQQKPASADDALVAKARAIHERVITLDTHDDINRVRFHADNYTQDSATRSTCRRCRGGLDAASSSSTSARERRPRLHTGGYDDAYRQAVEKFEAIHRLTKEMAPDKIGLALTSADARRLTRRGRRSRSSASKTAIRSATSPRRSSGCGSSPSAAPATSRSPTTATASSPTRTPAKREGWMRTGCRRSASR